MLAAVAFGVVGALLIVLFGLAGCSQPEFQGLKLNPTPWQDGETSIYRVTDEEGLFVGNMQIDIDALGDDSWTLRREIVVPGATEIVSIVASEAGLRPQQSMMVRTEPDGRESSEATYENGQTDIKLTSKLDITTYERMNVPSDVRDQRSLILLTRMMPLDDGYAVRVNSFLPIAGLLERGVIQVRGDEEVETPAGRYDTWIVDIGLGEDKIRAWVAKEAPYPVVKYEDDRAEGVFELIEFEAGQ